MNSQLKLMTVVSVATVFAACGTDTPTAPTTQMGFAIAGHVTDNRGSVPRSYAAVGLTFGDQRVTTDSSGNYTLTVTPGDYTVRVDGESSAEAVHVRNATTKGDLVVGNVGGCGLRYGQITDAETGDPIAAAYVDVTFADSDRTGTPAVSDATGWYRIDGGCGACGLCPRTTVVVSQLGYANAVADVGNAFRDAHRWDVALQRRRRAGETGSGIEPPARTRLIAGDYLLTVRSPLPAGCPMTSLDLGGRLRLTQRGDAVGYSTRTAFFERTFTGTVVGDRLEYSFSEIHDLTPTASVQTFVGGGVAIIEGARIVGGENRQSPWLELIAANDEVSVFAPPR
jgi:hypothetical protein